MAKPPLHLFTIEPSDPFLPRLAKALLSGDLVAGINRNTDPLTLADVTILVPTRRSARALRSVFAAELGQSGALLPDIVPLGEFEDDAFDLPDSEGASALPAIGQYQRLLALAPLVERWRNLLSEASTQTLFASEAIVLPASRADAIWLARELATLIDEAATESADWSKLDKLEEARDLADWRRLTNKFLSIITAYWPEELAALGCVDPSTHRSQAIETYRLGLERGDTNKVIIAAGSTGSIPATARLLETIAKMPCGAVVLPGLDTSDFSRAALKRLYPATSDASAIGHPQYGLVKLLHTMKADIADVAVLGSGISVPAVMPDAQARRKLVTLALLPASDTGQWAGQKFAPGILDNSALIEAENEREEALAIAVALRQAIEMPTATAALVTPNRLLAQRVAAELKRFGIEANDSGGTALTATNPGSFLLRLVEALYGKNNPLAILALIKHPLFCCGYQRAVMRGTAENFELYVLRGRNGRPQLGALANEVAAAHADRNTDHFSSRILKTFSAHDIQQLDSFTAAFDAAVAPAKFEGEKPLSAVLITVISVLEQAATNHDASFERLYEHEAGQSFAKAMRGLIEASAGFMVLAREVPDVLRALLVGETVKPRPGGHSRIAIWGTLEARLQTVDTVICGGLNEGTWPSVPESGPFMSRLMQQEIALEPPERRIGQSAHDFEQLLGLQNVIISRSVRAEGAPSEAARWLQRIAAVAGPDEMAAVKSRGDHYLNLARRIDVSAADVMISRPEPKPPLAARPKHYSVTDIETLRRDPYASFARKILKLYPLEDLIADPDARTRGNLFHAIMHEATRQNLDYQGPSAAQNLENIASQCFAEAKLPAEIAALWRPRFTSLVSELVLIEAEFQLAAETRHSELASAKIPVGATGVTLSARADRVDLLGNNQAVVMDYKTGSTPTISDAKKLDAPQLALEVALLGKGAFSEFGTLDVVKAVFVRLKTRSKVKPEELEDSSKSAADFGQDAWERLEKLFYYYKNETHGYVSRAFPGKHNSNIKAPYDHLARVFEWSATNNETGDDGSDADGEADT